ncbi:hypothetical protein L249_7881, partial [Ophiocordyceps polyrhachis-furcata BCC 54312]
RRIGGRRGVCIEKVGKPSFFYRQFLRNKGTYPTPL